MSLSKFDGLLALGALFYTSKFVFEENSYYSKFATDMEGLERAANIAGEALGVIEDINQVIGHLMAYVDQGEVWDEIYRVGWVLVALSELSKEIRTASDSFRHSIKNMKSE